MTTTFLLKEKFSRHWPAIVWTSALLAGSLYGLSHLTDGVLLAGYLQLGAFIFFALFLLGLLKVRDGRMEIELTVQKSDDLTIRYRIDNRQVDESSLPLSTIQKFEVCRMPDRSLYNNLNRSDRTLRYKSTDETWHYLAEYRGRVIPFTGDHADRALNFLNGNLTSGSPS